MQNLPLKEVINIIRYCDIEDAVLFEKRYTKLMVDTRGTLKHRKFSLLCSRAKKRLIELNYYGGL